MIRHIFKGYDFVFEDTRDIKALIDEIFGDNYEILKQGVVFSPGDVILDAGANEGVFSIMMSKLFPEARIISIEPVTRTFNTLIKNISHNNCKNITAYEVALGKPGDSTKTLIVSKDFSGGSTAHCTFNPDHHIKAEAKVISLDEAFALCKAERLRLLKMDIEGAEYDALYSFNSLDKVDYLVMEVHINTKLEFDCRRPDGLINWVGKRTKLINATLCKMAE